MRSKPTTIYKRGVKQIIKKDYKGRFFEDYGETYKSCLLCLPNGSEF